MIANPPHKPRPGLPSRTSSNTRIPGPAQSPSKPCPVIEAPSPPPPTQIHISPDKVPGNIRDDKAWTDGNFAVITADHVRFRVNDYLLFAFSTVFADARSHAICTSPSAPMGFHLTDPDFETAEVFSAFLTLATTLRPPAGTAFVWAGLMRFLGKWGCTALYDFFYDNLQVGADQSRLNRLLLFVTGSILDDAELCKRAVQSPGKDDDTTWNNTKSGDSLDPTSWTLSLWEQHKIPPRYLYAVIQAWHITQPTCKSRLEFATEFEKILTNT